MKLVSDFVPMAPIPEIAPPDVGTFDRQWGGPGLPVVIRGLASEWPASSRWSASRLREIVGSKPVKVAWPTGQLYSEDADAHIEALTSYASRKTALGDYLTLLEEHPETRDYLEAVDLRRVLPELADDIRVHDLVPLSRLYAILFWLGPAKTATAPHWDAHHNLLTQISGHKRVTLYAPNQHPSLYPISWRAKQFPTSALVNVVAPDLQRFPRYATARPVQTVIGPGDVVFIPACWWHFVENLDSTVALNFWWWPGARTLRDPSTLYLFTRAIGAIAYRIFARKVGLLKDTL